MKEVIAYALLVIGVPLFVGMAVGSILAIPIAWLLRSKTSLGPNSLQYLEAINGFAASLAGALLFRLFGLTPGVSVPGIMMAWVTVYFYAYKQPKLAWVSWLAGLLLGWLAFSKVFST